MNTVAQLINGEFVTSASTQFIMVQNPATNEDISQIPVSTKSDMQSAIDSAQRAFYHMEKGTCVAARKSHA